MEKPTFNFEENLAYFKNAFLDFLRLYKRYKDEEDYFYEKNKFWLNGEEFDLSQKEKIYYKNHHFEDTFTLSLDSKLFKKYINSKINKEELFNNLKYVPNIT